MDNNSDVNSSKKKEVPPSSFSVSPSEDENPSKKTKAADCRNRESELIVVKLFNTKGVTIPVPIERKFLRMIDFFKILVDNLEDDETEITLEEEDIYKATSFLLEMIDFYSKRGESEDPFLPPITTWDGAKAILSTKWLAEDYVKAFSSLASNHIKALMERPVDLSTVEVSGASWLSSDDVATAIRAPSPINGIYEITDELSGGMPIYRQRGLIMGTKQLILMYHMRNSSWHIKEIEDRKTNICWAHVNCGAPTLPHLIKEVWSVFDQDTPGASIKLVHQSTVKVSLVPTVDILLFWEMIHTVFQFVGLRKGPIHTMEDLVEELSKRRDLCVKEDMIKLLTKEDFFLLNSRVFDRIPPHVCKPYRSR